MKRTSRLWTFRLGLMATVLLFSGKLAYCQATLSAPSSSISDASPLLLQFEQTQQALGQQMMQLIGQGATPAQLTYWVNQNQGALQAQQALAIQLGTISAAQPLPYIDQITIPAGASPDQDDFLTAQAGLANLRAQIHNQLLQEGVVSGDQESTLFQQQAGATLQAQAERAQRIAAVADAEPLPVPPALSLPSNASPVMQAFLTLRDQLVRGEIQVHNQNLQVAAPTREAALQAWRQAHQSLFQQLQALAQNLSSASN